MTTLRLLRATAACLVGLVISTASLAAPDSNPTWASLTPAQQQALAPLQRDWAGIDAYRKLKWIAVASRFPSLPSEDRLRVQQRMTEWSRLSPAEREKARLIYSEARRVSPEERQAKWRAYQALPEDERRSLAAKAQPQAKPQGQAARSTDGAAGMQAARTKDGETKRNLVQAPASGQVRPVAPLLVQANPGATTSNLSARSPRPSHNQAGLPKVAATPGYVDTTTLLPKRGAQGAAAATSADELGSN